MGIDPSAVNVADLEITRPDRSALGGDQAGAAAVIGTGLEACHVEEDKLFRRPNGREVVSFGRFFLDPILDELGEPVEIVPGDLAKWSNAFGTVGEPQEIVSVEATQDCDGRFDVLTFRVGRS